VGIDLLNDGGFRLNVGGAQRCDAGDLGSRDACYVDQALSWRVQPKLFVEVATARNTST